MQIYLNNRTIISFAVSLTFSWGSSNNLTMYGTHCRKEKSFIFFVLNNTQCKIFENEIKNRISWLYYNIIYYILDKVIILFTCSRTLHCLWPKAYSLIVWPRAVMMFVPPFIKVAELYIVNNPWSAISFDFSFESPNLSMTILAKVVTTFLYCVGCVSATNSTNLFKHVRAAYDSATWDPFTASLRAGVSWLISCG